MVGLLRPRTITKLKQVRGRGLRTVKDFWADAYVIWSLDRPDGWDEGEEPEGWLPVETGVGKLKPGGIAGLGDMADEAIFNEAQYEFSLDRVTVLTTNDLLVTDGRVFHVDRVATKDSEHAIVTAYLTERVGDEVPQEVVMP